MKRREAEDRPQIPRAAHGNGMDRESLGARALGECGCTGRGKLGTIARRPLAPHQLEHLALASTPGALGIDVEHADRRRVHHPRRLGEDTSRAPAIASRRSAPIGSGDACF